MTVRILPPVDLTEEELASINLPKSRARFEEYFSFDEALWRAETRQAKQHAESFDALLGVSQCIYRMIPMLRIKQGANQLKLAKHLKDLEFHIADIKKLDPSNLTPELERMLFVGSLGASMSEYYNELYEEHDSIQAHIMPIVHKVAKHYWRYEQGSVLDAAGRMDLEIEFIDVNGEVAAMMSENKALTARQARNQIMTRAVNSVRVHRESTQLKVILAQLKKNDAARFKHVTKLGEPKLVADEEETTDE